MPNYILLVFCVIRQNTIVQRTQKILQIISLSKFHFRTSDSTYKIYRNLEKSPQTKRKEHLPAVEKAPSFGAAGQAPKRPCPTRHNVSGGTLLDPSKAAESRKGISSPLLSCTTQNVSCARQRIQRTKPM